MRRMFSEKQIKRMSNEEIDKSIESGSIKDELDKKANLEGANFTDDVSISGDLEVSGDLSAKTIYQSQASYSQEFDIAMNDNPDITITKEYCKFVLVNNSLQIIINAKLTNSTESAQTIKTISLDWNTILPESLSSKIYDIEGDPLSTPISQYRLIALAPAFIMRSIAGVLETNETSYQFKLTRPSTGTAGRIAGAIFRKTQTESDLVMQAGETYVVMARLELLII